tara:strand:- start:59 stop:403 length:345 start_codon:yes stop_codon:yes gene_type:complete
MHTYKAGDFTSGKMGEIYKNCFKDDYVVITHKQFGKMYLVDEEIIKNMAIGRLQLDNEFVKHSESYTGELEMPEAQPKVFRLMCDETQIQCVKDFYEGHISNWFEVLQVAGHEF